jgi:hypothetical protein
MYLAPKTYTCQHDARLTRYCNNMRYSGFSFVFFVSLTPPATRSHTCAYVTRMKDNVSRSFEMRHVVHDTHISSGQ